MKCNEHINGRPCGGVMRWGKAMIPVYRSSPDFIGDKPNEFRRGQTVYPVGSKFGNVMKCEKCGHSVIKRA